MDLLPFDEYVRSLNRKRMSAGVLFRDEADRVLFVEPSYKPHWDIPGGACEEGEPPWRTAAREVTEEVGIDRPLGNLLVIDYIPDDSRMPEGMAYVFDGGQVTEAEIKALTITDPEILSVELLPLDTAALRLKPILARRIAVALDAARAGELLICEDGRRVAQ
ncbi:NUDIX hydrolase [Amycolatopsis mongoliensis]|uniref:NUDIX hydrolase n=1 Tax=Amycolatopsis mongoliensis TaxID=715475 RepID=A0A9Y2JVG9_9PSEU|nr:NUDIX hydrolase [Amycolatopsis sp. 4-36]WIY04416.1 NUDIX hydrolase [Amycolatopsis sp. 4-36]